MNIKNSYMWDLVFITGSILCFLVAKYIYPFTEMYQGISGYIYDFGWMYHISFIILILLGSIFIVGIVVNIVNRVRCYDKKM